MNPQMTKCDVRDIIMRSFSIEERSIFSVLNFDLDLLEIDDIDRILEEIEMENEETVIPP